MFTSSKLQFDLTINVSGSSILLSNPGGRGGSFKTHVKSYRYLFL